MSEKAPAKEAAAKDGSSAQTPPKTGETGGKNEKAPAKQAAAKDGSSAQTSPKTGETGGKSTPTQKPASAAQSTPTSPSTSKSPPAGQGSRQPGRGRPGPQPGSSTTAPAQDGKVTWIADKAVKKSEWRTYTGRGSRKKAKRAIPTIADQLTQGGFPPHPANAKKQIGKRFPKGQLFNDAEWNAFKQLSSTPEGKTWLNASGMLTHDEIEQYLSNDNSEKFRGFHLLHKPSKVAMASYVSRQMNGGEDGKRFDGTPPAAVALSMEARHTTDPARRDELKKQIDQGIANEWAKTLEHTEPNDDANTAMDQGAVLAPRTIKDSLTFAETKPLSRDEALDRYRQSIEVLKNIFHLLQAGAEIYDAGSKSHVPLQGVPVAKLLSHGGRVNIQIPEGSPPYALTELLGITDSNGNPKAGVFKRDFGTHHISFRKGKLKEQGGQYAAVRSKLDDTELYGINLAIGGLGLKDFNGDVILPDGAHGHVFIGHRPPKPGRRGALQIGIETTGPGAPSTVGYVHNWRSTEKTANPISSVGGLKQDKIGDEKGKNARTVDLRKLGDDWKAPLKDRADQFAQDLKENPTEAIKNLVGPRDIPPLGAPEAAPHASDASSDASSDESFDDSSDGSSDESSDGSDRSERGSRGGDRRDPPGDAASDPKRGAQDPGQGGSDQRPRGVEQAPKGNEPREMPGDAPEQMTAKTPEASSPRPEAGTTQSAPGKAPERPGQPRPETTSQPPAQRTVSPTAITTGMRAPVRPPAATKVGWLGKKLGTGGHGFAGMVANEGAAQREQALADQYELQIGPDEDAGGTHFSHKMLDHIEKALGDLPPEHVTGSPTLRKIIRDISSEQAASAYNELTDTINVTNPPKVPTFIYSRLNRRWNWQRKRMDRGAIRDYDGVNKEQDRALGITEDRHVMGGVSDVLANGNLIKWTMRHEIGHSIDKLIDWKGTLAEDDRFGGWKVHSDTRDTEDVARAILAKAGITDDEANSETDGFSLVQRFASFLHPPSRREDMTPLEDFPADAASEDPDLKKKLEKAVDTVKFAMAQPWTLDDGGASKLEVDGRIYHVDHYDQWVSYRADARNNAVSNYQFSTPAEWFAETYASYYDPSPAPKAQLTQEVRDFFENDLPGLVSSGQERWQRINENTRDAEQGAGPQPPLPPAGSSASPSAASPSAVTAGLSRNIATGTPSSGSRAASPPRDATGGSQASPPRDATGGSQASPPRDANGGSQASPPRDATRAPNDSAVLETDAAREGLGDTQAALQTLIDASKSWSHPATAADKQDAKKLLGDIMRSQGVDRSLVDRLAELIDDPDSLSQHEFAICALNSVLHTQITSDLAGFARVVAAEFTGKLFDREGKLLADFSLDTQGEHRTTASAQAIDDPIQGVIRGDLPLKDAPIGNKLLQNGVKKAGAKRADLAKRAGIASRAGIANSEGNERAWSDAHVLDYLLARGLGKMLSKLAPEQYKADADYTAGVIPGYLDKAATRPKNATDPSKKLGDLQLSADSLVTLFTEILGGNAQTMVAGDDYDVGRINDVLAGPEQAPFALATFLDGNGLIERADAFAKDPTTAKPFDTAGKIDKSNAHQVVINGKITEEGDHYIVPLHSWQQSFSIKVKKDVLPSLVPVFTYGTYLPSQAPGANDAARSQAPANNAWTQLTTGGGDPLGTGGHGLAGLFANKGAADREQALAQQYNLQVGPGDDGGGKHFSHKMLDHIGKALGELPAEHVTGNPTLQAIIRDISSEESASAYDELTDTITIVNPKRVPTFIYSRLNRRWKWQRERMDRGAIGDYDGVNKEQDRALGITEGRHVMGGVSDVLANGNLIKWTMRHEVGHSIDKLVDWRSLAGEDRFGGWKVHSDTRDLEDVTRAIFAKAGITDDEANHKVDGFSLLDRFTSVLDPPSRRKNMAPLEDFPANVASEDPDLKNRLEEAVRTVKFGMAQPWTLDDGGASKLAVGGRIYHVDQYDNWVSYRQDARNNAVSNYQFSTPAEWFAETYASYYDPSPAPRAQLSQEVRDFFENELPGLVEQGRASWQRIRENIARSAGNQPPRGPSAITSGFNPAARVAPNELGDDQARAPEAMLGGNNPATDSRGETAAPQAQTGEIEEEPEPPSERAPDPATSTPVEQVTWIVDKAVKKTLWRTDTGIAKRELARRGLPAIANALRAGGFPRDPGEAKTQIGGRFPEGRLFDDAEWSAFEELSSTPQGQSWLNASGMLTLDEVKKYLSGEESDNPERFRGFHLLHKASKVVLASYVSRQMNGGEAGKRFEGTQPAAVALSMEAKHTTDPARRDELKRLIDQGIVEEWSRTLERTEPNDDASTAIDKGAVLDPKKKLLRQPRKLSKDEVVDRHRQSLAVLKNVFHLLQAGAEIYDDSAKSHVPLADVPVAKLLSHGGRVNVQIPAGSAPYALTEHLGITDKNGNPKAGVFKRSFGTHHVALSEGTFKEQGGALAAVLSKLDDTELYGINLAVGGLGLKDFNGDVILPDGAHGHMFIGYRPPRKDRPGALQIGMETTGPNAPSTVGYVHNWRSTEKTANPISSVGGLKADKIGDDQIKNARTVDLGKLGKDWARTLKDRADRFEQDLAQKGRDALTELVGPRTQPPQELQDAEQRPGGSERDPGVDDRRDAPSGAGTAAHPTEKKGGFFATAPQAEPTAQTASDDPAAQPLSPPSAAAPPSLAELIAKGSKRGLRGSALDDYTRRALETGDPDPNSYLKSLVDEIGGMPSGFKERAKELLEHPERLAQQDFAFCGLTAIAEAALHNNPVKAIDVFRSLFDTTPFPLPSGGAIDVTPSSEEVARGKDPNRNVLLGGRVKQIETMSRHMRKDYGDKRLDIMLARALPKLWKSRSNDKYDAWRKDVESKFDQDFAQKREQLEGGGARLKRGDFPVSEEAYTGILKDVLGAPDVNVMSAPKGGYDIDAINELLNDDGRAPFVHGIVLAGPVRAAANGREQDPSTSDDGLHQVRIVGPIETAKTPDGAEGYVVPLSTYGEVIRFPVPKDRMGEYFPYILTGSWHQPPTPRTAESPSEVAPAIQDPTANKGGFMVAAPASDGTGTGDASATGPQAEAPSVEPLTSEDGQRDRASSGEQPAAPRPSPLVLALKAKDIPRAMQLAQQLLAPTSDGTAELAPDAQTQLAHGFFVGPMPAPGPSAPPGYGALFEQVKNLAYQLVQSGLGDERTQRALSPVEMELLQHAEQSDLAPAEIKARAMGALSTATPVQSAEAEDDQPISTRQAFIAEFIDKTQEARLQDDGMTSRVAGAAQSGPVRISDGGVRPVKAGKLPLENYTLQKIIGKGVSGNVALAEHQSQGETKKVVVKKIKLEPGKEREQLDNILRESAIQMYLMDQGDEPVVVKLQKALVAKDSIYIVLEPAEGSLASHLQKDPPSRTQLISIFHDLAGSYAVMHKAGILHKDIKADNVLVKDGKSLISDFGLSKRIDGVQQRIIEDTKRFGQMLLEHTEALPRGQLSARDLKTLNSLKSDMGFFSPTKVAAYKKPEDPSTVDQFVDIVRQLYSDDPAAPKDAGFMDLIQDQLWDVRTRSLLDELSDAAPTRSWFTTAPAATGETPAEASAVSHDATDESAQQGEALALSASEGGQQDRASSGEQPAASDPSPLVLALKDKDIPRAMQLAQQLLAPTGDGTAELARDAQTQLAHGFFVGPMPEPGPSAPPGYDALFEQVKNLAYQLVQSGLGDERTQRALSPVETELLQHAEQSDLAPAEIKARAMGALSTATPVQSAEAEDDQPISTRQVFIDEFIDGTQQARLQDGGISSRVADAAQSGPVRISDSGVRPVKAGKLPLENYTLQKIIGKGVSGNVALAEHQSQGETKKVVVKKIKLEAGKEREQLDNILRESAIQMYLMDQGDEPVVVKLQKALVAKDSIYIVLDPAEGSLESHLQKDPPSRTQLISIFHDLAGSYAEMHKAGILHKDIKADNVLVKDKKYLISDFGLSKRIDGVQQRINEDAKRFGLMILEHTEALARGQLSARDPKAREFSARDLKTLESLKSDMGFFSPTKVAAYTMPRNPSTVDQLVDIVRQLYSDDPAAPKDAGFMDLIQDQLWDVRTRSLLDELSDAAPTRSWFTGKQARATTTAETGDNPGGVYALGSDKVVLDNAKNLAGKEGHRPVSSDQLGELGASDKLTIVAHGSTGRFGGMTPTELAAHLKENGAKALGTLSLKGCESADFARELMGELQKQGIAVERITGRNDRVTITSDGRTLVSDGSQWVHQAPGTKVEVRSGENDTVSVKDAYAHHDDASAIEARSRALREGINAGALPELPQPHGEQQSAASEPSPLVLALKDKDIPRAMQLAQQLLASAEDGTAELAQDAQTQLAHGFFVGPMPTPGPSAPPGYDALFEQVKNLSYQLVQSGLGDERTQRALSPVETELLQHAEQSDLAPAEIKARAMGALSTATPVQSAEAEDDQPISTRQAFIAEFIDGTQEARLQDDGMTSRVADAAQSGPVRISDNGVRPVRAGKLPLENYTLQKIIGKGISGNVALAEHQSQGETKNVVVKKIKLEPGKEREQVDNILRESAIQMYLMDQGAEPVVVKLQKALVAKDSIYIVLEPADGSLESHLQKDPPSRTQLISIFHDLAGSYAEMHSAGILHKDIKADNVLVKDKKYLISDFGLSKRIDGDGQRIDEDTRRFGQMILEHTEALARGQLSARDRKTLESLKSEMGFFSLNKIDAYTLPHNPSTVDQLVDIVRQLYSKDPAAPKDAGFMKRIQDQLWDVRTRSLLDELSDAAPTRSWFTGKQARATTSAQTGDNPGGVYALGSDKAVLDNAKNLAGKEGHRPVSSDQLGELGANDKLTIVAHGSTGRFGGMTPAELAAHLKENGAKALGTLSLKGCESADFARELMGELQKQGIAVERITGRNDRVTITKDGRTLVSDGSQWVHQAPGTKVEVRSGENDTVSVKDAYAHHDDASAIEARSRVLREGINAGSLPDSPLEGGQPARASSGEQPTAPQPSPLVLALKDKDIPRAMQLAQQLLAPTADGTAELAPDAQTQLAHGFFVGPMPAPEPSAPPGYDALFEQVKNLSYQLVQSGLGDERTQRALSPVETELLQHAEQSDLAPAEIKARAMGALSTATPVQSAEAEAEDDQPISTRQAFIDEFIDGTQEARLQEGGMTSRVADAAKSGPVRISDGGVRPVKAGKLPLENYTLQKIIGKGVSGNVALAEHQSQGETKKVVVKKIKLEPGKEREQVDNILRESAIQMYLMDQGDEPVVVKLQKALVAKDSIYIVLDPADGSLESHLQKDPPSRTQLISIFHDLAGSYAVMHKAGILHKDIKADNVLVKDKKYLISDFGLSKRIDGVHQRINEDAKRFGLMILEHTEALARGQLSARDPKAREFSARDLKTLESLKSDMGFFSPTKVAAYTMPRNPSTVDQLVDTVRQLYSDDPAAPKDAGFMDLIQDQLWDVRTRSLLDELSDAAPTRSWFTGKQARATTTAETGDNPGGVYALGSDKVVLDNAKNLAGKEGHRPVSSDQLGELGASDKLTIVAHGSTGRFGGMTPAELAAHLKENGAKALGTLSLKGCESADFARELMGELQKQGIAVERITGRNDRVTITKDGRTLVSDGSQWVHQAPGTKVEVRSGENDTVSVKDAYAHHDDASAIEARSRVLREGINAGALPDSPLEGGQQDRASSGEQRQSAASDPSPLVLALKDKDIPRAMQLAQQLLASAEDGTAELASDAQIQLAHGFFVGPMPTPGPSAPPGYDALFEQVKNLSYQLVQSGLGDERTQRALSPTEMELLQHAEQSDRAPAEIKARAMGALSTATPVQSAEAEEDDEPISTKQAFIDEFIDGTQEARLRDGGITSRVAGAAQSGPVRISDGGVRPVKAGKLPLENYTLQKIIGKGVSGNVALAEHQSQGETKKVVVKKIKLEPGKEREQLDNILRESAIQMYLMEQGDKPVVVKLQKALVAKDSIYIVLDPADGSLESHLQKDPPSRTQLISIFHDLAGSYAEMHKAGILHKDIKADNVLVKDKKYLISDFGLSKRIDGVGQRINEDAKRFGLMILEHTEALARAQLSARDPKAREFSARDLKTLESLKTELGIFSPTKIAAYTMPRNPSMVDQLVDTVRQLYSDDPAAPKDAGFMDLIQDQLWGLRTRSLMHELSDTLAGKQGRDVTIPAPIDALVRTLVAKSGAWSSPRTQADKQEAVALVTELLQQLGMDAKVVDRAGEQDSDSPHPEHSTCTCVR
ncbi:protein kinase domain-containing protein [Sorangium sp. So ce1078]|uniref:protein kinase domain-containing protein n=1 Tax=Sorangium sp. So ce1078 TaxID=3133329 RepID=UPI003F5EA68C